MTTFLFHQGPAKGLGSIRFHDYRARVRVVRSPQRAGLREQVAAFRELLATAPPSGSQTQDIDFLLAGGELFALVVYAQLILENARLYGIEPDLVDQIFDFLVRDFSEFALQLYNKASSTPEQMRWCLQMIKKPAQDARRYDAVWTQRVLPLAGAYEMNA